MYHNMHHGVRQTHGIPRQVRYYLYNCIDSFKLALDIDMGDSGRAL